MYKKMSQVSYNTIYGINNCISFLKTDKKFSIQNIFINKSSKIVNDNKIFKLVKNKSLVKYLDKDNFNRKFNFKHSQGIVIRFNGHLTTSLLNKNDFSKNSCLLLCDQINDPQNLGQIIRTSECAGVNGIVLPKHQSVQISDTVIQVSQGAFFSLNVYSETNLNNTIKYLKSIGFWIVGIENSINAQKWHQIDYNEKIAIVIGSEGKGIRPLIKKSCDFLGTIPMLGKTNSLNVTAALSAVLFERQRQLENIL